MDASIFKKSESELAETNSVQSKDSLSENGELVQKSDLVLLKLNDDNDDNINNVNDNSNNNDSYDSIDNNSNLSCKAKKNNIDLTKNCKKIEINDIENQNIFNQKITLESFSNPFHTKRIEKDEKKSSKLISAIIDKNLLKAAEIENIFVDDYGKKKIKKSGAVFLSFTQLFIPNF